MLLLLLQAKQRKQQDSLLKYITYNDITVSNKKAIEIEIFCMIFLCRIYPI